MSRADWLRSITYGEQFLLQAPGGAGDVIPVRVVRIDSEAGWLTVVDERAEDLPENCRVICCRTGQDRFGSIAIPSGKLSYVQALAMKQPASMFPFSRYIMTGVLPSHYGRLRPDDAECKFDFTGCLDAPPGIPGGSHEMGDKPGQVSTSLVLRSEL